MKSKISGGFGILWGGGILINGFLSDPSSTNSVYQTNALIIGGLIFAVGLYTFFKKW